MVVIAVLKLLCPLYHGKDFLKIENILMVLKTCKIVYYFLDAEAIKLFYMIFTFIVKIKMDLIKLNAFQMSFQNKGKIIVC